MFVIVLREVPLYYINFVSHSMPHVAKGDLDIDHMGYS